MTTPFPIFTDVEDGETPPPEVPDVDAAYLNSVNSAINTIQNTLPGKVDSSTLALVATSGNYTDLIGKPFIPTAPEDIGAQPAGSYATTTDLTTKADVEHAHGIDDLVVVGTPTATNFLRGDGTWAEPVQTGVTDHAALTGLDGDDHPQYHTDARGDARYYLRADVDTALADKADAVHVHAASDITSGRLAAARMPVVTSTVRVQAFASAPTLDPAVDGNNVNITATGNITALGVSTTGAADRQVVRVAVLASGAPYEVTFAAAVRASTGLTRGPYAIPAGEVLYAALEYSSLISAWTLTAATVSAT